MDNNDVLRKIRYAFDFSDAKMMKLFSLADLKVSREEVSNWLKRDEDPEFKALTDEELATFLNGFIVAKRGKREGPQPQPEKKLNNNIVFRKLKIALSMTDTDIINVFQSVDLKVSKHEVNALFRKPTQSQYRICKDQFLRNFLQGLEFWEE